jgi:hypothetical protein
MLKKSASGVLTSLRGSTYQSVRLTSSLAAALPDSLFEHPAGDPALSTYLLPVDIAAQKLSFSAACRGGTYSWGWAWLGERKED